MIVKSVPVRAAAALTGSNVDTLAVSIRGARMVAFVCSATDAVQLSAATPQLTNDGTNWVSSGTIGAAPTNGKANAVFDGAVTSLALNAGAATLFVLPGGSNNIYPPFFTEAKARLRVSTAGTVAGFAVTALVFYDEDTRQVVGDDMAGILPL